MRCENEKNWYFPGNGYFQEMPTNGYFLEMTTNCFVVKAIVKLFRIIFISLIVSLKKKHLKDYLQKSLRNLNNSKAKEKFSL